MLVVPEITIPGFEGVVYGAVTSFTNQARSVTLHPACSPIHPSLQPYPSQAQNMTNAINNLLLAIWPSNTSNEQLDLCALPGITAGIDETGTFGTAPQSGDGDGEGHGEGHGEGEGASAAFSSLSRSFAPRGVATSCREVQLHTTHLTLTLALTLTLTLTRCSCT